MSPFAQSVSLVALGSSASLIGTVLGGATQDWLRRRQEVRTRWDSQRLAAMTEFSSAVSEVLRCGDYQSALDARRPLGPKYEALVLLATTEVVLAADRARRAAFVYAGQLPEDGLSEGFIPGEAHGWTSKGRQVVLTPTLGRLQATGYARLTDYVSLARQELRVVRLRRNELKGHSHEATELDAQG